ncbi:hypothetical protein MPSEU_000631900 [Mayamaea pseudoterrestris]|nr:hypothetical protein MPSEU_000631900 [Mayamaea pseudoterrestris]
MRRFRFNLTALLALASLHHCSAFTRPALLLKFTSELHRIRKAGRASTFNHEEDLQRSYVQHAVAPALLSKDRDCRQENYQRQQLTTRPFRKRFIPILISILACVIIGKPASAVSLSVLQRAKPHCKLITRLLLGIWIASVSFKSICVKQRQAIDATLEWGRYARHPGSRGRALGWLLLRVSTLWLMAQVCTTSSRGSRRKQRLLTCSGNTLADGLLRIGPLYIKLGQIVSCRNDVLPEPWIKSLEKLQDQVPSKKGADALELAYNAWRSITNGTDPKQSFHETFDEFDTTPIAAASLGQVHRAKLKQTGEQVAIKLQRSYLRQIYDQDLAFLKKIAASVDKFASFRKNAETVSQSWTNIFSDAERILYREIDYRDEAENGARFCRDFGIALGGKPASNLTTRARDGSLLPSAAPWLRAPYVYTNLCSEKVLVMELVPSIKITDIAKLDASHITMADREYLADMLGRSYLRQFCCNLFFSTDPHPGNLGVEILNLNATTPAKRVRLVFYDFGQAATLKQAQADGILTIIDAIVDMDVDRSIEAFQQMGVLVEGADLKKVRAKVAENYKVRQMGAISKRL